MPPWQSKSREYRRSSHIEGRILPFCFSGLEEITAFLLSPINVTTARRLQRSACLLRARARHSTSVTSHQWAPQLTVRRPSVAPVVTALLYTSTAAGSKQRRVCAPAVSACAGPWLSTCVTRSSHYIQPVLRPRRLSRTVQPCHSSSNHRACQ